MIIWINGPFGAGKTVLSDQLKTLLPHSFVFDPEELGIALRHLVPDALTWDYEDLPIWRSMTLHALIEVRRLYRRTVIVPMTLVNQAHVTEIVGGLAAAGEDVIHIFLDAEKETVRSRIIAQVLIDDPIRDQELRQWRLARIDRCLAARDKMPEATIFLNSDLLEPTELANEVLSRIRATHMRLDEG